MTREMFERLQQKDPRYLIYDYDEKFGVNKITYVCLHLGKPISAYRRECKKGINSSGDTVGVKPCCDCGPAPKCEFYSPNPDAM